MITAVISRQYTAHKAANKQELYDNSTMEKVTEIDNPRGMQTEFVKDGGSNQNVRIIISSVIIHAITAMVTDQTLLMQWCNCNTNQAINSDKECNRGDQ